MESSLNKIWLQDFHVGNKKTLPLPPNNGGDV